MLATLVELNTAIANKAQATKPGSLEFVEIPDGISSEAAFANLPVIENVIIDVRHRMIQIMHNDQLPGTRLKNGDSSVF